MFFFHICENVFSLVPSHQNFLLPIGIVYEVNKSLHFSMSYDTGPKNRHSLLFNNPCSILERELLIVLKASHCSRCSQFVKVPISFGRRFG